ncbi:aminoacyl-tRNA hydrolase [Petroclostridium sp. X23]|uniref:aminoacyl-tRNA hydrolase n=1 Tax=Petroclostridium sp. X23 TaxID=3045146 RepID=UPI0024ACC480|nr:aminoacyl-tRNA hydrolase [Petroclostridium sp. X23]WHH57605.1 aminoacyl-tRNA hydrolase [Petroclostridium sp. X23]
MHLIVGLGNPGSKYAGTRHNVGFEIIDYLAALYHIKVEKIKHKALIGEGLIQGKKVVLAKPQTYMNLSGESIREMKEWYKIDHDNIVVIYDDISLELGKIRIRHKGSAGGHNGIKSIIYQLKSEVFPRIKIGVGQPSHPEYDLADFVLSKLSGEERKIAIDSYERAADAVPVILQAGVAEAMNRFNGG